MRFIDSRPLLLIIFFVKTLQVRFVDSGLLLINCFLRDDAPSEVRRFRSTASLDYSSQRRFKCTRTSIHQCTSIVLMCVCRVFGETRAFPVQKLSLQYGFLATCELQSEQSVEIYQFVRGLTRCHTVERDSTHCVPQLTALPVFNVLAYSQVITIYQYRRGYSSPIRLQR